MADTTDNIPLVKVLMPPRESLLPALEAVLYSGMIAEGAHVYSFEAALTQHFNLNNVLATSSGTAALHIAMLLAGVNAGDEVITTSMTAEPTNTTILQVGAIPIFADVDVKTGNLDPEAVELLITDKTKAICVVHYAGYPANLTNLRAIADKHGIKLIEDCAHALGALYAGAPIGTMGDFAIFSFQAIKHMTTIDGGALIMKDASRIDEAKRLRWFGLAKGVLRTEVDIKKLGFKYNMNNVTATIGLQQLIDINSHLDRHRSNGQFFDNALRGIAGLTPAKIENGAEPTYWLYTLLAEDSNEVESCLTSNGISASKLHRPNHLHSIFEPYRRPLPRLEEFYQRLVHIPCGWWVTDEDRERIVSLLKRG